MFDVDKEIGEREWRAMEEDLEKKAKIISSGEETGLAKSSAMDEMFKLAGDMKFLSPERYRSVHDKFDNGLRAMLGSVPYSLIFSFKTLYPEEFKAWFTLDRWRVLRESIVVPKSHMNELARMKIAAPERDLRTILDENLWRSYQKMIKNNISQKLWRFVASNLSNMRILFPEQVTELTPDASLWESLLEDFKKESARINLMSASRGSPTDLAAYARDLKILAAKDVRITDEGLELIMTKKETHREKVAPRPIRPNF